MQQTNIMKNKVEKKTNSKSFIEGLLENLINRAINGLTIKLNNLEIKIKYLENIFIFKIGNLFYSEEEKGIKLNGISLSYMNSKDENATNIINNFNINIDIIKSNDENETNKLNINITDFVFELSQKVIYAFNDIHKLVENTKYMYIFVRYKKLIFFHLPHKPENLNTDENAKKNYFRLLWLYGIKTVIKLRKYLTPDEKINNKYYLFELFSKTQQNISNNYINNNNEDKLLIPNEINLLKATKEKVKSKVLENKKGNVLTNAFSFFFGGKSDDDEKKNELTEEEEQILESIYTDENILNYLLKGDDTKNESNPIKGKIMGFFDKLNINFVFNKMELILINNDGEKCNLYISEINIIVNKNQKEIKSILSIKDIGSNLANDLFNERDESKKLIEINKDDNIKINFGFNNIKLNEKLFSFLLLFFSGINIKPKKKLFKKITYENKPNKENEENEQKENKLIDNFDINKLQFSNTPSLTLFLNNSNINNEINFSVKDLKIAKENVEFTLNIKDSFSTILDNYNFKFNTNITDNKFCYLLDKPLNIILSSDSSRSFFFSYLQNSNIYEKIKKNKRLKEIANNNDENNEKELFDLKYVVHKKINLNDMDLKNLVIDVAFNNILIEINENTLYKTVVELNNFHLKFENSTLDFKIDKLLFSTNLMSTMVLYFANIESPNLNTYFPLIENSDELPDENDNQLIDNNNDNEIEVKYHFEADKFVKAFNIEIKSMNFYFTAEKNTLLYEMTSIIINKNKEDNFFTVDLAKLDLSFNKENNIICITNLKVNYDMIEGIAKINLISPRININLNIINEIKKSLIYLIEQIDLEVIVLKVKLEIQDLNILLDNMFNIKLGKICVTNCNQEFPDSVLVDLYEILMVNLNNNNLLEQKEIKVNLIIKSNEDFTLEINLNTFDIYFDKNDIKNFMLLSEKSKNEGEIKHYKKKKKIQKTKSLKEDVFSLKLKINITDINITVCSNDNMRINKLGICFIPVDIEGEIKTNNSTQKLISKEIELNLEKFDLKYYNDNGETFYIISSNVNNNNILSKSSSNYSILKKSSIISLNNLRNNSNEQLKILLNNNNLVIYLNKNNISLKFDILLWIYLYFKDLKPVCKEDNKKNEYNENNNNNDMIIKLNMNETQLSLKNNEKKSLIISIDELNIDNNINEKNININNFYIDIYSIIDNKYNKLLYSTNKFLNIKINNADRENSFFITIDSLYSNISFEDIYYFHRSYTQIMSYLKENNICLVNTNNNKNEGNGSLDELTNKAQNSIELKINKLNLKIVDNYNKNYFPLIETNVNHISVIKDSNNRIDASFYLEIFSYNYIAVVWEPLIEKTCIRFMSIDKIEKKSKHKYLKIEIYKLIINISDMFISSTSLSMNNLKKYLNQIDTNNTKSLLKMDGLTDNNTQTSSQTKIINYTGIDLNIKYNNNKYKCESNSDIDLDYNYNDKNQKIVVKYDNTNFKENEEYSIKINELGINNFREDDTIKIINENIINKNREINSIFYSPLILKNKTNYNFTIKLSNMNYGNLFLLLKSNSICGIPYYYYYDPTAQCNIQLNNSSCSFDFNEIVDNNSLEKKINLNNNEIELSMNLYKKSNNINVLFIYSKYVIVNCLPVNIQIETQNKIDKIKKCSQFLIDFKSESDLEIRFIIKANDEYFYSESLNLSSITNIEEKKINYIVFRNKGNNEIFKLSLLVKEKKLQKIITLYSEYLLYNDSNISFEIKSDKCTEEIESMNKLIYSISNNLYLLSNGITFDKNSKSYFKLSNSYFNSSNILIKDVLKSSPTYDIKFDSLINSNLFNLNLSIKKNISFISVRNNSSLNKGNVATMIFKILPQCHIINLLTNKNILISNANNNKEFLIIPPFNKKSFNYFNYNEKNCNIQISIIDNNKANVISLFNLFNCGIYTFYYENEKCYLNFEIKDSFDNTKEIYITKATVSICKASIENKTNNNFIITQFDYETNKQLIEKNKKYILNFHDQNQNIFEIEINNNKYQINLGDGKETSFIEIENNYILLKENNGIYIKIILYNKNDFMKKKSIDQEIFFDVKMNNIYCTLIGDNESKDKKLRNYKRSEILLFYLNDLNFKLTSQKSNDLILMKKQIINSEISLKKIEIYNQLSIKGKYSCIFKSITYPFTRLITEINLYQDSDEKNNIALKINDFFIEMGKLQVNIESEFIFELIDFFENLLYRLNIINYNVDNIFLRTSNNIKDKILLENLSNYKNNNNLICSADNIKLPPIDVEFEVCEIDFEKLLRNKVGCDDLFTWLGLGLVNTKQYFSLYGGEIRNYFGNLGNFLQKLKNHYKEQSKNIIINMGIKGFFGQMKLMIINKKSDKECTDVKKNRIKCPRVFYGKYKYFGKNNENENIVYDNICERFYNDFKENNICNKLIISESYYYVFCEKSLYVFSSQFELCHKIEYVDMNKVTIKENKIFINQGKEKKENNENKYYIIECDNGNIAKKVNN